jgi:hypothetical protein
MCSLLFAARTLDRNAVDSAGNGIEDVLQILSGAKPVIGVSKRCCHICRTIMLFLGEHHKENVPVIDSHGTITPYVLPPLLPPEMRRRVVNHYRDELKKTLRSVTEVYRAEEREKACTPESHPSLDSHPVSSDATVADIVVDDDLPVYEE